MSILRTLSKRRGIASIVAAAVLAAAPITVAVLHDGFPLSDVDLHALDVWVTNESRALAGRLNTQISELDGGVAAASKTFDVLQNGTDVFVPNGDDGSIQRVDPSYATLEQKISAPAGAAIAYGGGRIAILRPGDGALWLVDATGPLQFDPASPPVAKLGQGAVAAVGLDGTVGAVSVAKHAIYEIAPGTVALVKKAPFSGSDPQVTLVGSRAVALDAASGRLQFDDGKSIRPSDRVIRLQQPGPDRGTVLAASGDALLQVSSDGRQTRHPARITHPSTRSDDVAAPVVLGSCLHGAWTDAARYLGVCAGRADAVRDVQVGSDAHLEFRVNRDVIALNNVVDGDIWLVRDAQLVHVDANWDQATPPSDSQSQNTDTTTSVPDFEQALAERSQQNHPPIARPDHLGARPGRTTILDVLANDTDPDGDVLTISNLSDLPASTGKVEPIEGGRALQFVPADGFIGTASFQYSVSDGRGGTSSAQVDVTVAPASEVDHAPVQSGTSAVTLEAGKTISYNVLGDWFDPDGDDLILENATSPGAQVRFSPDGLVTYTQLGAELGSKKVTLSVSDGQKTTTGTFLVDVKAIGDAPPIGTPDFASTFTGVPVQVSPLQNDLSPSGAQLALGSVTALTPGITAVPDPDRGTVSLTAGAPGAYYVQYVVQAGTESSKGLIRVDVSGKPAQHLAPVAVKDVAYVRPNQPVTLSVLDNDVSPSGAVLGVQSVDVPASASQLSVQVLGQAKIKITAPSGMTQPVQFSYTISDGTMTSTAGVSVVPIPELTHHQAPIAIDDQAKVRVGDIVSVPVLDNDFHPDGAQILLDPQLVQANVGDGLAFVTGDQVRLQAPTKPGQYTVVYRDYDAFNESATARVTFTVLPKDPKDNAAPHPIDVATRVFEGSNVHVSVPLQGIDPDGDSVSLVSVAGESLGTVLRETSTGFDYQAYPDKSGTDTLTYEVHDAFGASATAQVRIGVIPRPATVYPPDAVDDQIAIRPGRTSSVPVLLNDSDPNGYKLDLEPKLLEVQSGITAKVDLKTHDVVVTASQKLGTYSVRYAVTNNHGGTADAFLIVKVDPKAPLQPPVAFDQNVDASSVIGKRTVKVDVLHDAQNPGGLVSDLKVAVIGPDKSSAHVNEDGTVEVTLTDAAQAVAYTLTNTIDHLSATAFITVPRYIDSRPPYLRTDLQLPVNVPMNGSKTWKLSDLITVPSGRPARLAYPSTASAGRSNGDPIAVDDTTIRYSPEKGFRGQTAITFRVTDGDSTDDPNAATIVLPVLVGDPNFQDVAPTFANQTIEIQPGEAVTTFDLRSGSAHPNPQVLQQLSYQHFTGGSGAVKASLSGSTVSMSAPVDTPVGTTAVLKFDVVYQSFSVPGQITVKVAKSTRPLPQAVDDSQPEGRPSSTYTIDPLANDFNPFADQGKPLKITDVQFRGDALGATQTHTDSAVTVRTGTAKSRTISLVYTIRDATNSADREVQGLITVVVRSAPDVVSPVHATADASNTVSVTFSAPATNGAPIDYYAVTVSGPGQADESKQCQLGALCQFTDRTNGQPQRFTVAAHNVVGMGPAGLSNIVNPYAMPGSPSNPVIAGSHTATSSAQLSWLPPSNEVQSGGTIHYEWAYTEGSSDRSVYLTADGVTHVDQTLQAGTYAFKVRACNPIGCSDYVSSPEFLVSPPPPPQPNMMISQPSSNHWIHLVISGYPANTTYSIACWATPQADGQNGHSIGSFTITTNSSGGGTWDSPNTCTMTGGGYGNLRSSLVWSNTIALN